MKDAKDVIPWKVTDISARPYDDFWSFNPSVHFDGSTWRCVLRCCDYAMPKGVTVRSKSARPTGQQTKNAMVILDPESWKIVQVFKMHEKDGLPRESVAHVGFEDMRIFKTEKGGLQGIAASLHLKRDRKSTDGNSPRQPPEQVLLSFDASYDIVGAQPIRGDGWSGTPQKNWVPFDHVIEPRFLYSIDKGTLFGDRGAVHGQDATARSSMITKESTPAQVTAQELPALSPVVTPREETPAPRQEAKAQEVRRPAALRGSDVRIVRGGRVIVDAHASRPSSRSSSPSHVASSRASGKRVHAHDGRRACADAEVRGSAWRHTVVEGW